MSGTDRTSPSHSERYRSTRRGWLSPHAPLGVRGRYQHQCSKQSEENCDGKPMLHTTTLLRLLRPAPFPNLNKPSANEAQSQVTCLRNLLVPIFSMLMNAVGK